MTHKRGEDASKTPKDEQRTPPELFKKLDERFHFDIDAACTEDNCLCRFGFTKDSAGPDKNGSLDIDWSNPGNDFDEPPRIWCNPPYSNGKVKAFLEKGLEESLKGAVVVFLISCDVSPNYYDICALAAEWIAIKGRVEFCHEDGTPIKGSAMFGSMVVVFDYDWWVKQGRKTIVTRLEWKDEKE